MKRAKRFDPRRRNGMHDLSAPVSLRDIFRDLGVLDDPAINQKAVKVMLRTRVRGATMEEVERTGNVAHIGPEVVSLR